MVYLQCDIEVSRFSLSAKGTIVEDATGRIRVEADDLESGLQVRYWCFCCKHLLNRATLAYGLLPSMSRFATADSVARIQP